MQNIHNIVTNALEDLKAQEINTLDVGKYTSMSDQLVFATGTSTRHTKAIASNIVLAAKGAQIEILGVEGMETGDWILVDLGQVIVHVMVEEARNYYKLEDLWSLDPASET